MAVQVPPQPQLEFHGVYTAGNPIQRPAHTAAKCSDFRVMPGYWLRLAGGRVARYNIPNAINSLRILPYRDPHFPGSSQHFIQTYYTGGAVSWSTFSAGVLYALSPAIETIATNLDGAFAQTNPAAACLLADRPLLYNGLGVLDANGSRPPFSTYFGGVTRYYGIDAYCPAATPSVAFAAGAGFNIVSQSVDIYVGLYSSQTGHYSNAIKVGTISTTNGATGTVTVSNLQNLKTQFHNATEQAELNYVFYATVDGGAVPYLILNSTLTGPFTVPSTSVSASLSIIAASFNNPNGWPLDLVHEGPLNNYPPRPMQSVCYVNSRVYGALLNGGSGSRTDFSYTPVARDLAAVVWSSAAGDSILQNVLGDPNQCWPLGNIAYTPSSDAPVVVMPAQDNQRTLVITATSTFLLQEVTDGIHRWIEVSRKHGCGSAASVVATPYGICWVNQYNESVMLPPFSTQIVVLSREYQSLLTGTVTAADWVYDPVEQIDRYQVWMNNGTSVIHDFALRGPNNYGEAYTRTNQPTVGAAGSLIGVGVGASVSYVIAGTAIYTHERQPDTGLTPTTDQTYVAGVATTQEINGEYDRNWEDFSDSSLRKEFTQVDLTADGVNSNQLGASPLAVTWFGDFEQVNGGVAHTTTLIKNPQYATSYDWIAKLSKSARFWFKVIFKLSGHHTDDATFANHQPFSSQGDLAKNFYGCILRALMTNGVSQNR